MDKHGELNKYLRILQIMSGENRVYGAMGIVWDLPLRVQRETNARVAKAHSIINLFTGQPFNKKNNNPGKG